MGKVLVQVLTIIYVISLHQVWKLSQTDMCELARNSVLMSGFEHEVNLPPRVTLHLHISRETYSLIHHQSLQEFVFITPPFLEYYPRCSTYIIAFKEVIWGVYIYIAITNYAPIITQHYQNSTLTCKVTLLTG